MAQQPQQPQETKTLVVNNFQGDMTQVFFGDINSGRGNVDKNFGANPFLKPQELTWNYQPIQIDPNASVITDLVMCGKERIESGNVYVYAVGHTGRVYKIQVNNTSTFNPDYDNPILLTTISTNSPTFTRGGFIDFFGATERLYIGHDKGVTMLNFDGTGETFVGTLGSWTQSVPRPLKQFLGKLYAGNGSNIAEITDPSTVTFYQKLSPGFPNNTQSRDLELTPDGSYLNVVVSRLALPDITSTTQDITNSASAESYLISWNGTDQGYTSLITFPSFSLTSNKVFGQYQYTFGNDFHGHAIFNPVEKIITEATVIPPLPNAIQSNSNIIGWTTPFFSGGNLKLLYNMYGQLDREVGQGKGYWTQFSVSATGTETDVLQCPLHLFVSNFGFGASSNGYLNSVYSTAKIYYSTLETSSAPTTKYKLYKWDFIPTALTYTPTGTPILGVYQTQCQQFSKKIIPVEVRVYGEPWVTNNSFTIDLVGADGNVITNGSKTFATSDGSLVAGNDFAWYNPETKPVHALAVRVTNAGTANHTITRIEIDYAMGGK